MSSSKTIISETTPKLWSNEDPIKLSGFKSLQEKNPESANWAYPNRASAAGLPISEKKWNFDEILGAWIDAPAPSIFSMPPRRSVDRSIELAAGGFSECALITNCEEFSKQWRSCELEECHLAPSWHLPRVIRESTMLLFYQLHSLTCGLVS